MLGPYIDAFLVYESFFHETSIQEKSTRFAFFFLKKTKHSKANAFMKCQMNVVLVNTSNIRLAFEKIPLIL